MTADKCMSCFLRLDGAVAEKETAIHELAAFCKYAATVEVAPFQPAATVVEDILRFCCDGERGCPLISGLDGLFGGLHFDTFLDGAFCGAFIILF